VRFGALLQGGNSLCCQLPSPLLDFVSLAKGFITVKKFLAMLLLGALVLSGAVLSTGCNKDKDKKTTPTGTSGSGSPASTSKTTS